MGEKQVVSIKLLIIVYEGIRKRRGLFRYSCNLQQKGGEKWLNKAK
jgi:hypothetical protein